MSGRPPGSGHRKTQSETGPRKALGELSPAYQSPRVPKAFLGAEFDGRSEDSTNKTAVRDAAIKKISQEPSNTLQFTNSPQGQPIMMNQDGRDTITDFLAGMRQEIAQLRDDTAKERAKDRAEIKYLKEEVLQLQPCKEVAVAIRLRFLSDYQRRVSNTQRAQDPSSSRKDGNQKAHEGHIDGDAYATAQTPEMKALLDQAFKDLYGIDRVEDWEANRQLWKDDEPIKAMLNLRANVKILQVEGRIQKYQQDKAGRLIGKSDAMIAIIKNPKQAERSYNRTTKLREFKDIYDSLSPTPHSG